MDTPQRKRRRDILLPEWLRDQIDSGNYPGLEWVCEDELIFKVPWINLKTSTDKKTDFKIFIAYSEFKKKPIQGNEPTNTEYADSKHRFSNALPKVGIMPLDFKELTGKIHGDKFKFYQFRTDQSKAQFTSDSRNSASPANVDSTTINMGSSDGHEATAWNRNFFGGNIPAIVEEMICTNQTSVNPLVEINTEVSTMQPGAPQATENIYIAPDFLASPPNALPDSTWSPPKNTNFVHDDLQNVDHFSDMGILHAESAGTFASDNSVMSSPGQTVTSPETLVTLEIFYGSNHKKQVFHENLTEKGCKLHHGRQFQIPDLEVTARMYGDSRALTYELPNVGDVLLSDNHWVLSEKEKSHIGQVLGSMVRGFLIRTKDDRIQVKRLCHTKVYFWDGKEVNWVIERTKDDAWVDIFDFQQFNKKLEEAVDNHSLPNPYGYLTFGQNVKRDRENPLNSVLIYALITYKPACRLHSDKWKEFNPCESLRTESSFDTADSIHDKLVKHFQNMTTEQL